MQILTPIPECAISLTSKEDGSIDSYETLVSLPLKSRPHQQVYLAKHEHATRTWVIGRDNKDQVEHDCDIVLTNSRDAVIVHQFADCVPLLLVDRKQKAICFAHSGWKGLTMGSVQVALLSLQAEFRSSLDDIWVWIGPCIQPSSYVFEDQPIQTKLPVWKENVHQAEGKWAIDLPGFIQHECARFGIDPARVISDGRDTYSEQEVFFSHQRFLREQNPQNKGVFAVACSLL